MQEVNRFSPQIIGYESNNLTYQYIKVIEGERIYFPKAVEFMCDLKVGEYVHFLNEEKDWMFYTSDNKDGFKITSSGQGLLQITSYPLSRMILKSTGHKLRHKFFVKKTGVMHDKCQVFKLEPDRLGEKSR